MVKSFSLYILLAACFHSVVTAQTIATDSLLNELSKAKEDTNKVNTYFWLSRSFRFTEPDKAIAYGHEGILLAKKLHFDAGAAGCYLNVSVAYNYLDKIDSAMLYLDTALLHAHKVGDPNRLGLAYLNRADFYRQQQNFSQSLKDCDTALMYADRAGNDDVRARVNQTLGSVYYRQKKYEQGIIYNDRAIGLYRKIGNMRMSASVLNNLGLIYKDTKEFEKGVASITKAIRITDSLKDITNLALFHGNLSELYIEMGEYEQALTSTDHAMKYALMQNNEMQVAMAQLVRANAYIKQKKLSEAIDLLTRSSVVFKREGVMDSYYSATDLLAEAYELSGNYPKAFEYMKISKDLNDSIVRQQYADEVAAMQTKFKVDEKDKEIQLLAKDKELQQQKLSQQRVIMIAFITIAVLALAGIWLAVNRNRLRQKMKELELRNQIASDLHDEVGSSLSSIHMLSQMASQKEGNAVLQQDILTRMSTNAKETMDKMGDIVWMIKPDKAESTGLKQRMERFAYEICGTRNIAVSLQLEDLEKVKLSMNQRKNIYLVFKEAINNAVKYSGTDTIRVTGIIAGKEFVLVIKDEGKGFDNSRVAKGNGLDNMQQRAKDLHGTLVIDTHDGTSVKLVMPA
jgi:two-component system, NarL family, sensor histidine kinase UhpB